MKRTYIAAIAATLLMVAGCVSSSQFATFQYETRRDLSALRDNLRAIERDIEGLREDMRRTSQSQAALDSKIRDWLSRSELKLKEMEERVIEIRLMLRRVSPSPK